MVVFYVSSLGGFVYIGAQKASQCLFSCPKPLLSAEERRRDRTVRSLEAPRREMARSYPSFAEYNSFKCYGGSCWHRWTNKNPNRIFLFTFGISFKESFKASCEYHIKAPNCLLQFIHVPTALLF